MTFEYPGILNCICVISNDGDWKKIDPYFQPGNLVNAVFISMLTTCIS